MHPQQRNSIRHEGQQRFSWSAYQPDGMQQNPTQAAACTDNVTQCKQLVVAFPCCHRLLLLTPSRSLLVLVTGSHRGPSSIRAREVASTASKPATL